MPLIVDLDGTASRTDTLVESLLRLLKLRPFRLFVMLPGFFRDRAAFKAAVARTVSLDPASLAYNPAVIELAKAARAEGRAVYLVTGANAAIAQAVAGYLRIFDGVFASDGQTNLTRENKAALLCREFGERGYAYVGDAAADVPVWRHAGAAIVVAPRASLLRDARAACADVTTIGKPLRGMALVRQAASAMHVHRWIWNLLIFVPVLGSHAGALVRAGVAFLAAGLCASSVYVLNDLLDLPHDRLDARKRLLPFAAGTLDLRLGPPLAGVCLLASGALALLLPSHFGGFLAGFFVLALVYSSGLKRRPVIGVVVLAGLYTLRLALGGAAAGVSMPLWLLVFSMFVFACLGTWRRLEF